jgi:hypothetical protein
MATNTCQVTAKVLMNRVPHSGELIEQNKTFSDLITTIQVKNNSNASNLTGMFFSSSNYIKIKRVALEQNLVTPPSGLLGGLCRIVPTGPALGDAIPPSSNLATEINKILAGSK